MRFFIYILFNLLSQSLLSQGDLQCLNFKAFIKQDIQLWDSVVSSYKADSLQNTEVLKDYVQTLYGYVGFLYLKEQKKKAQAYNEVLEQQIDLLQESASDKAFVSAMRGACYGYKVMLNSPFSSMYNFARCLNYIEYASEVDTLSAYAWTELGNVQFQMVYFLGGDYGKVASYYRRSLVILEKSKNDLSCDWYYLNTLLFYAKCFEEQNMPEKAVEVYDKILALAPGFEGARRWRKKQKDLID